METTPTQAGQCKALVQAMTERAVKFSYLKGKRLVTVWGTRQERFVRFFQKEWDASQDEDEAITFFDIRTMQIRKMNPSSLVRILENFISD